MPVKKFTRQERRDKYNRNRTIHLKQNEKVRYCHGFDYGNTFYQNRMGKQLQNKLNRQVGAQIRYNPNQNVSIALKKVKRKNKLNQAKQISAKFRKAQQVINQASETKIKKYEFIKMNNIKMHESRGLTFIEKNIGKKYTGKYNIKFLKFLTLHNIIFRCNQRTERTSM